MDHLKVYLHCRRVQPLPPTPLATSSSSPPLFVHDEVVSGLENKSPPLDPTSQDGHFLVPGETKSQSSTLGPSGDTLDALSPATIHWSSGESYITVNPPNCMKGRRAHFPAAPLASLSPFNVDHQRHVPTLASLDPSPSIMNDSKG